MDLSKKVLTLSDLTETELQQFDKGAVVVMKVTRKMTDEEFSKFSHRVGNISDQFRKRGVFLVIVPEWLDFVVLKPGEKVEGVKTE